MGMMRYDDDALRARVLELWKEVLSFREIARRFGCNVYKVGGSYYHHRNIRSQEQSRLKS